MWLPSTESDITTNYTGKSRTFVIPDLHSTPLFCVTSQNYARSLHHRNYGCWGYFLPVTVFAYALNYRKRDNSVKQRDNAALLPMKVIQGHRIWYQSTARIRGFLSVVNSDMGHIFYRFRDTATKTTAIAVLHTSSSISFENTVRYGASFVRSALGSILLSHSRSLKIIQNDTLE